MEGNKITIEEQRKDSVATLPDVNLVKCYSIHELAKKSGLSDNFIEQECEKFQASNGRMGLPWFRRGTRRGIYVLSFAEFMHRLEKEVLLG